MFSFFTIKRKSFNAARDLLNRRANGNGVQYTRSNRHYPPAAELHPVTETDGKGSQVASLQSVFEVVNRNYGSTSSIADCTEACISSMCSLLLTNVEGCIALVIEGPPSSGKTEPLRFLGSEPLQEAGLVLISDSFTPASFVSHAAARTQEQLTGNDLLPRIRHKAFIIPDLAPIFSGSEDKLAKNMGTLTRVLDGQGFKSDSGVHGRRGYGGDFRFTLLAATTPLGDKAWKVMSRVGNRILLLEAGSALPTTEDLVASMRDEISPTQRVEECAEVVSDFLIGLWEETGGYGSVTWDAKGDDEGLVRIIARVAQWVVRCRGSILPEFPTPQVESPYRLNSALYNLAKGHAIACGRRNLASDDVRLAVRIGLDSMPLERRHVMRALLRSEDGQLISPDATQVLDKSRPTARKVMDTLAALGAVEAGKQGNALTISLLESEHWLMDQAHRWALDRIP